MPSQISETRYTTTAPSAGTKLTRTMCRRCISRMRPMASALPPRIASLTFALITRWRPILRIIKSRARTSSRLTPATTGMRECLRAIPRNLPITPPVPTNGSGRISHSSPTPKSTGKGERYSSSGTKRKTADPKATGRSGCSYCRPLPKDTANAGIPTLYATTIAQP